MHIRDSIAAALPDFPALKETTSADGLASRLLRAAADFIVEQARDQHLSRQPSAFQEMFCAFLLDAALSAAVDTSREENRP